MSLAGKEIAGEPIAYDDAEAMSDDFYASRWTDGLPVVAPTEERVARMLGDHDGTEPLGTMPPRWRRTYVHHVAVNAVMAGCRPDYFPVVLAGIRAVLDPGLNLYGVQGTTNPAGVMLVVNGPARTELDVNSGHNLFGQGWRANATIGRAIRLCLINIGGGLPELGDMSTLGNPNKYGSCIAENEEESPWAPFHVERGFAADRSVVTAAGVTAPQNIAILSQDPIAILDGIAGALMSSGSNLLLFTAQPLVVIGPVHAKHLARNGYDKKSVREYLWEKGTLDITGVGGTDGKAMREWKARCYHVDGDRELLRPAVTPDDIGIVVAGGRSGPHSAVLQPFNITRL
ncbi:MAG TPA: UGSC family (seleno)protein, partial [Actinophytocola sp.]